MDIAAAMLRYGEGADFTPSPYVAVYFDAFDHEQILGPCAPKDFRKTDDGAFFVCNGRLANAANGALREKVGWSVLRGEFGVFDGKLYLMTTTPKQVCELCDIVDAGYPASGEKAYVITAAGALYALDYSWYTTPWGYSPVPTPGGSGRWTKVVGGAKVAYGIMGGKLYRLIGNVATQIHAETGWTKLVGRDNSDNARVYGICNGKLYHITSYSDNNVTLHDAVVTRVGAGTAWTDISGYYQFERIEGYITYIMAYGICGGSLYKIEATTAQQIDGNTDWSSVYGYNFRTSLGYETWRGAVAMRAGAIYKIINETVEVFASGYLDATSLPSANGGESLIYAIRNK